MKSVIEKIRKLKQELNKNTYSRQEVEDMLNKLLMKGK